MTSEPLPAEDRAQAPDAELVRDDGLPVALSSLWAERPLVLVFFGELANPFTGDQAANLRDADEAFARADADIAAIVPAAPEQSLAYRHHWMLPYPLFTDAQGRAHEAFGVAPGASATFVIDRDGAIRLARHAANLADYPPTSTLLTAVCDITGAEPPEQSAPLSYAQDEPASQRIDGKLVSFQRFTCGKCGYGDCERSEIATAGGFLSRIFNLQHKKFVAVSCSSCGYTELYKRQTGLAGNVTDVLFGA